MPGFQSKLDTDTLNRTLQRYQSRELTRKLAAEALGISEPYFAQLARKAGVGVHAKPGTGSAVTRSHEVAAARADIRDQAVIDVVYGGMTQTDAAKKYGVSRLAMNHWITAYNAELQDPTPEDQRPRETDKRNLKS